MIAVWLAGLAAWGSMNQAALRPVLTYQTAADSAYGVHKQSDFARWRQTPSDAQLLRASAALPSGGARASLRCGLTANGRPDRCDVYGEPEDRRVRNAALRLAGHYRLDTALLVKARQSAIPPRLLFWIMMPDRAGHVPDDCSPAFGCIIEPSPPPPPLGQ